LVKIEFDPAKDAINRAKHGISLQAADDFDWETALEREDDRFDYGEVRFVAIGRIKARDGFRRRVRREQGSRHQPSAGREA
jgi:hypothetical protein